MRLLVENVVAGYGRVTVLQGLTLNAGERECVALFGPNGHGKTTLFRAISGLVTIQSGSVTVDGQSLRGRSARAIVEMGVIHVPQGSTIFPTMTVEEGLLLGAYPARAWRGRKGSLEDVYGLFPQLVERRGQRIRTLSGGERQMLAIGMGLMAKPEVLLLDEPTLGLAPLRRLEVARAIRAIVMRGVTMLLVDQDLDLLFDVADRLYAIERGRVASEAAKGSVVSRDELLSLYFGGTK
jgi:branched-chain amino acid transport system ATP-binding protein